MDSYIGGDERKQPSLAETKWDTMETISTNRNTTKATATEGTEESNTSTVSNWHDNQQQEYMS